MEIKIQEIITKETNIRNKVILKSLYYLGLRASEICDVKWCDLLVKDDGTGTLTIFGKGSKTRFLIVPKPLLKELLTLKKDNQTYIFTSRKFNGKLNRTQLWKIVKAAGKRCGIENFNLCLCRSIYTYKSLIPVVDCELLSDSLKHKLITTLSYYLLEA